MGLDMYLYKFPRYKNATPKDVEDVEGYLSWRDGKDKDYTLVQWCGVSETDINTDFLEHYQQFYTQKYYYWDDKHKYGYGGISDQIGYWRKANQIHIWFVKNIQNGKDDCGDYEVSEQRLRELLELCKEVCNKAVMTIAPVKNGYTFNENSERVYKYEDGAQIVNPEDIEDLLPSCGGFFFGNTDYDSYYMQDIYETIEILENALRETDFENEVVFYHSSW